MNVKCIRKKVNEKPIIDEVIINDDKLYVLDNDRRHSIFSLNLECNNDSIAYLELAYNIILVGIKTEKIAGTDIDMHEIYDIYDTDETYKKNISIKGVQLYGDIFVLKKIGNKYYDLNVEEIDLIMDILNKN